MGHGRDVIDRVDNLPARLAQASATSINGTWQRHVAVRFAATALDGRSATGRWGTEGGYPVLYLGRPTDSVTVEAYRHLIDPLVTDPGQPLPPIRPRKNPWVVGANYFQHLANGFARIPRPAVAPPHVEFFTKSVNAIIGHDADIIYDKRVTRTVDFELELTVVIGKYGKDIAALITAEYRIAKRPAGRILVDYNQNAWGRTLASVYSVRPRPRAPVSTPVTWDEVERGIAIDSFRLDNVRRRIGEQGDLWKPLLRKRGRANLERLLKTFA